MSMQDGKRLEVTKHLTKRQIGRIETGRNWDEAIIKEKRSFLFLFITLNRSDFSVFRIIIKFSNWVNFLDSNKP
jgi:hypothetical protein